VLHQRDEPLLIGFAQARQRVPVRGACRGLHFFKQGGARGGQFAGPRAAVVRLDRPLDKAPCLQAFEGAGGRGSVEGDVGGQGGLIGGPAHGERRQKAILQWRDFEGRAPFLKQRHMDLMQPPHQETRPLSKLKRWRLKEIIRKTALVPEISVAEPGQ